MHNDLDLIFLTTRAPPSVTSPTARLLHDPEGAVLTISCSFLSSVDSVYAVRSFLTALVFFRW